MQDPTVIIKLEPPEILHELHGVRHFDYFQLNDGTYLVPETTTVGLWNDMDSDGCTANIHREKERERERERERECVCVCLRLIIGYAVLIRLACVCVYICIY